MQTINKSPGDDKEVFELVKKIADPSLTEMEVREKTGEKRDLKEVSPGIFLVDYFDGGMSSKWLYYRGKDPDKSAAPAKKSWISRLFGKGSK
jgi:hypothetical protein